jgi:hypothetical protein
MLGCGLQHLGGRTRNLRPDTVTGQNNHSHFLFSLKPQIAVRLEHRQVRSAAIAQNNRPPKRVYSIPPTQNIDLNCLRFRAKFDPMSNRWIGQKSGDRDGKPHNKRQIF